MGKTPEYTKKAVDNYRSKFDIVQLRLPKGTKENIKERLKAKESISDYINNLIVQDINNWFIRASGKGCFFNALFCVKCMCFVCAICYITHRQQQDIVL